MKLRDKFRATNVKHEFWNHQPFTVISSEMEDDIRITTIRFTDGHEVEAFDDEIYLLEGDEEFTSAGAAIDPEDDKPEAFYA